MNKDCIEKIRIKLTLAKMGKNDVNLASFNVCMISDSLVSVERDQCHQKIKHFLNQFIML